MPTFCTIKLGGTFNITDKGVYTFLQENQSNLKLIEEFVISGLPIRDETVLLLVSVCPSLKALGLGYLDLKEETIFKILSGKIGRQLEKLDLSWGSTTSGAINPQLSAVRACSYYISRRFKL